jgi:hypothetical protein
MNRVKGSSLEWRWRRGGGREAFYNISKVPIFLYYNFILYYTYILYQEIIVINVAFAVNIKVDFK